VSKKKFKTSEPFGSALRPNLLRYQPLAIVHYGCMSGALPSEQNNATIGCLSLPGLTGQSSRIVNFSLINPMDHPVKPDDDLIAYDFLIRSF
jgi:hypothetical protein